MSNTSIHRESDSTHSPSVLPSTELATGSAPVRQVMLSTPQQQALEWLFGGGSVNEAAQFAGVSRATVYRWMTEDEDFIAVYNRWREETAGVIQGRLVALSEAAMDNLAAAVRAKGDIRASVFILKSLGVGREK